VPRLASTLRACVSRWKLHASVPSIHEEGTTPMGSNSIP
jgi:hypothetical protein